MARTVYPNPGNHYDMHEAVLSSLWHLQQTIGWFSHTLNLHIL